MDTYGIGELMQAQKAFYKTQKTKEIHFRKEQLKKLKKTILKYEDRINEALWKDLHKSPIEVWETEIGIVLQEITRMIRNLNGYARKKSVGSPLLLFRAGGVIIPEPYGQILIISPWNYPFQLLFNPLVGAIAAGNCSIIRPSSNVPHTSKVMADLINECFDRAYVALVEGPRDMVDQLLESAFDYIFFTGSSEIGKKVMEKAAKNLIPVSLELGGKNPCFVTKNANLELAARRIVWGKFLNGGQSCVAIDYLLVDQGIKLELVKRLKYYVNKFYGTDPSKSKDLTHVVNEANIKRLDALIKGADVVLGGDSILEDRYFAPTIVDNVQPEDPLMSEEIFGPILPILSFTSLTDAIEFVNKQPTPLSVYVMSSKKSEKWNILNSTTSGFAGFNDSAIIFGNPNLPVGGKGKSGFGKYHGKASFDTFTHYRSVFIKKNKIDLPIRYPSFTDWKLKIFKFFLK